MGTIPHALVIGPLKRRDEVDARAGNLRGGIPGRALLNRILPPVVAVALGSVIGGRAPVAGRVVLTRPLPVLGVDVLRGRSREGRPPLPEDEVSVPASGQPSVAVVVVEVLLERGAGVRGVLQIVIKPRVDLPAAVLAANSGPLAREQLHPQGISASRLVGDVESARDAVPDQLSVRENNRLPGGPSRYRSVGELSRRGGCQKADRNDCFE